MKTAIVLNHDGMGHGDRELGLKILAVFLRKSPAIREVHAVILYNSGVKLAVTGSPVLAELHQLHENGVEILPCGTCLDQFGLREQLAVGEVSNMDAIVAELNTVEKVITL